LNKHGHKHGYDMVTGHENFFKSKTRGHGYMTIKYAYKYSNKCA